MKSNHQAKTAIASTADQMRCKQWSHVHCHGVWALREAGHRKVDYAYPTLPVKQVWAVAKHQDNHSSSGET